MDIFGTGGGFDPRAFGLLNAGVGLLQASGPSRTPVSAGQALSQGLLSGVQGYQQGQQMQQQQLAFQRQQDQQAATDAAKKDFLAKFPQLASVLALDPKTAIERAYPKPPEIIGKIDPKDYTPESLGKYRLSNNPADLVAVRPAHFTDEGGRITPRDPVTGLPLGQSIAKSLSPGEGANLAWKQFEFGNLSANQKASLANDAERIGISRQQLEEGRVQVVQDADGNFFLVNKVGGGSTPVAGPDGKPLSGQQKPTEAQMKAAVFHSQMAAASDELAKIPGYDPTKGFTQAETAIAGGRTNFLANQNAQRAKQAQNQWAEAFLRFKTGAASTPAEVALNVATFFPQIGDAPAAVAQKARMRAQAERDMSMAAGRKLPQQPQHPESPRVPGPMVVNWSDLGR